MTSVRLPLLLVIFLVPIPSLADGWVALFNGRDLEGWTERNQSGSFRVEDGAIVGTATEGLGTTFLCTDREFGDFELEFEVKLIDAELNSGVQIRSRNRKPLGKQKAGPVEGPQVEIAAANPEKGSFSGNIFGQGWGEWLTPKDGRRNHKFFKGGQWNRFRVLAEGDRVTVWINGSEVVTTVIPPARHKTHPRGFIGLQLHAIHAGMGPLEVAWKEIRVRELAATPQEKTSSEETPSGGVRLDHRGPETPFRPLPVFKGHTLSRFATAPEINCPVAVVAEPGGAIFALCDENAGLGRRPGQGRVWRLVDEDDDGMADYATPFLAEIDTPRGGQFVEDTLYLVHPPFISAVRDLDGDGVADEQRVLARGFGHDLTWKRGGDHTTNDLKIGLDGWLYVAVGDFGASAVGSDGSAVELRSGGVIRMRPDGSDLELHAEGTRNTYDLAINPRLDIIALDNTNDGDGWDMRLHHLTPLAHMGYPGLFKNFGEDAMPPLFSYGGGSGCGALFLEEPGFPDWINHRFHTINWGRLYTHELEPHEATFVNADRVTLSLNKIVDLDVDGSSRLYFASFENGAARTEPGAVVGYVAQAKPEGWVHRDFPDLSAAGPEELIACLDQGSGVLRQNAQWGLVRNEDPRTGDLLKQAAEDASRSLAARIAALFAINLRDGPEAVPTIKGFLDDDDLKEFALRALLDRRDCEETGLKPIIARCLRDEDGRVRLHAVLGARRLGLSGLTEELLRLAIEEERKPLENGVAHVHRVVPHTARRALIAMAPVEELHAALGTDAMRKPALAVLRQIHTRGNVLKLIEALSAEADGGRAQDLVAALFRLYHREQEWDGESWWGTRPNTAGPFYQGVPWEASEAIAGALRDAVGRMSEDDQKQVLSAARHHNLPLAELQLPIDIDPMEQLLEQPNHRFEQQGMLLRITTDPERPVSMRVEAFRAALAVVGFKYSEWCLANLEALAAIRNEPGLCETLSHDFLQSSSHRGVPLHVVPRAYPGVAQLDPQCRALFFDVLCGLAESPLTGEQERARLVREMKDIAPTPLLLESIQRNEARSLTPLVRAALKDEALAPAARELLGALEKSSDQLVGDLSVNEVRSAVLSLAGDAGEGKRLFERQSCVACHSVLPDEPQKGPYLGTAGGQFNREQLITHILEPGAEVAQGFQAQWFRLRDGTTVTGFVTSRTEADVSVRDMSGVARVVPTAGIEDEGIHEGSMMPPGLVNALTLKELASLIDYLETLH